MRPDRLDVKDIHGAIPTTNKHQKKYQIRDHMNVSDIVEEGRVFKKQQVIDKNDHILTDEILGKKKMYIKDHSPLEPHYIMTTKSKRMIVLGEIEGGRPKQFVKKDANKDTKRYMRVSDIVGASPKERTCIPETVLPGLHPMF